MLLFLMMLLMAVPAEAAKKPGPGPKSIPFLVMERGKVRLPGGAFGEQQRRLLERLDANRWPSGRYCVAVMVHRWGVQADGVYASEVELLEVKVQPRNEIVQDGHEVVGFDPNGVPLIGPHYELTGRLEDDGWLHAKRTGHRFRIRAPLPQTAGDFVVLWVEFGERGWAETRVVPRGPKRTEIHGVDPFVFANDERVWDLLAFERLREMPVDPKTHARSWERTAARAARLEDMKSFDRAWIGAALDVARERLDGGLSSAVELALVDSVGKRYGSTNAEIGFARLMREGCAAAEPFLVRALVEAPEDDVLRITAAKCQTELGDRAGAWSTLLPVLERGDVDAGDTCFEVAGRDAERRALCTTAEVGADDAEFVADLNDEVETWLGGGRQTPPARAPRGADEDVPEWVTIGSWSRRGKRNPLQAVEVFHPSDPFEEPSALRVEVEVAEPAQGTLQVRYDPPGAGWLTHSMVVDGPGLYRLDLEVPRVGHTTIVAVFTTADGAVASFGTMAEPLEVLED